MSLSYVLAEIIQTYYFFWLVNIDNSLIFVIVVLFNAMVCTSSILLGDNFFVYAANRLWFVVH